MENFNEEGFCFLVKVQRFKKRVSFTAKTLGVVKKLVFCVNRQKMRENLCFCLKRVAVVNVELLFLVLRN